MDSHLEGRLYNQFLDFDNDGIMEILAYEYHHPVYYSGMSRLHKIDTDNGEVLASYNIGENESVNIGLFPNKIAIANYSTGTAKVLNYNFNEIEEKTISENPIKLSAINDVNGDGIQELFIISENIFYLLDEDLNILWDYSYMITILAVVYQVIWTVMVIMKLY